MLREQSACLQCGADLQLVVVVHVPLQHVALYAAVACCLQSSGYVHLRNVADTERGISHRCHAALLVELAHPELVHPHLGTTLLVAVGVTYTDHDTLHALQCRVTEDRYSVLRLAGRFIVHDVRNSVAYVGCTGALRFVAS